MLGFMEYSLTQEALLHTFREMYLQKYWHNWIKHAKNQEFVISPKVKKLFAIIYKCRMIC